MNRTSFPGEQDLYLYVPGTQGFIPVKNFFDFPAAARIGGTHYFFSYHRSGCADLDWDSDLFYFRDFKAVRLGNISGVGCPVDEQEKGAIYIHKIRDTQEILVKKFPISIIDHYPNNKWGFVEQYWKRNYARFKDSFSRQSEKYFISGDFALDTVMQLPEVAKQNDYVQRATKGKRQLFSLISAAPDKDHRYYSIEVGEDNGMAFVTHFIFQVDARSGTVRYYDAVSGKLLGLQAWRKMLRKK